MEGMSRAGGRLVVGVYTVGNGREGARGGGWHQMRERAREGDSNKEGRSDGEMVV